MINPSQQAAVEQTEGPLLIIAGPGSGKTFTLVERVVALVQSGVPAEAIMVSTFTEKAAAELVTRVSSRLTSLGVSVNLNEMYIGTLHSICLRILDDYRERTRLRRSYTLYDQFDQQYMLYRSMKLYSQVEEAEELLGSPQTSRWRRAMALARWVNTVAEELLDVEQLKASNSAEARALGRLAELYWTALEADNALDFSTIQLETYHLLDQHPDVQLALREKIRYLMVDEYQDTNTVQEAIVLMLAGARDGLPAPNVCVVGDDDQGLYRFRGATIRNILEYPTNFKAGVCRSVKLETNYRSHPDIIRFFGRWMSTLNWTGQSPGRATTREFRFDKRIGARGGEFPEGPAVVRLSGGASQTAWHDEVVSFLHFLRDDGKLTDWNQVAFLFRSVKNGKVLDLAEHLEASGIPVYSPRSNLFFDRDEVQLMLGALLFLFPQAKQAMEGGWPAQKPPSIWAYYEQCTHAFAEVIKNQPERHGDFLRWARHRAYAHRHLTEPTDYAFSTLFYEVLQFPMFAEYLGDEALGEIQDSRPARNLALISKVLTKFEYVHGIDVLTPEYLSLNLGQLFNSYLRFLKDGGIDEFEDATEPAPRGCVSFMTIHQAKGLEFPVVMVGSLEAVPRQQHTSFDETLQQNYYRKPPFEPFDRIKMYDFWRLYYTAFSRAQNLLVLSGPDRRRGYGQVPSKYFRPVVDDLADWRTATATLEALPLEEIGDVDIKSQYSFTSHISVYENCPRQYKFFKALDFAPVRQSAILFGTLVHQTIEDIHRAALEGKAHLIGAEQIEQWFRLNYHNLSRKERRYLAPATQRAALRHVTRYVDRVTHTKPDWSHIEHAEVDVSLVKDAYILQGTVDLIEGQDGTVEIVDFKSEKKPDLHLERERVDRYRRQLEVYGHIIQERMGVTVSRLNLYYTGETSGSPYVSFDMNRASVDRTVTSFDEVVGLIEQADFDVAERPAKLCETCDLCSFCDRNH
ncbi:MAG: ATP-dependent DNA helicase [Bacteroidota bacterium]